MNDRPPKSVIASERAGAADQAVPLPSVAPAPQVVSAEVVPRRSAWSWAWLVPLTATVLVGAMVYQVWTARGVPVTIRFAHGDGITAGDPVTFRGVRVGEVKQVGLDQGLGSVVVRIELAPDAAGLAVEGSRFWIVHPEVSLTRVSGLDTLLGPRYIAVEPGTGQPAREFMGLDRSPEEARAPASQGLEVAIQAPRLGSLGIGSAIAYRGVKVGSVTGYQLSGDARTVELIGMIEPEFAHLVRVNSKFWDAGRIGLDWGILSGVTVKAGSLETLVAGGIAFATPNKPGEPASPGQRFTLEPKADDDWLQWSPDLSPPPGPRAESAR
jgi:paraquat-inducible protein B